MIRTFSATSLKLQGTRNDAETIKPLIDHYAEFGLSQVICDCDITETSNTELSQNLQKFEGKMPIFPFDAKFTKLKQDRFNILKVSKEILSCGDKSDQLLEENESAVPLNVSLKISLHI